MAERFFYYEPADYTACEEHMANALGEWFPEIGEECKGSMWNYEGWDIDELLSALKVSGELLPSQFRKLGTRMGDPDKHCNSLH
ncbi:hypothetical protein [Streptomyces sp. H27-H5]|uniref:hypothetical protein n=1 Tax=Streptomyces sp. H27-H5 TaxID=2996460 RepID=UPI00226F300E|nr:hypothetical protein [Streptomyces sp. H27-H5]MCY0955829.1 hypothetical protein [Streptomyces sp. H27-H5]